MAHQIENNRAFFTLGKPWHTSGQLIDPNNAYDNIIEATMDILPEAYSKETPYLLQPDGTFKAVEEYRIIMREDGTEIGSVRETFELLQPVEVVAPWQSFLDSGKCTLDCMGVLRKGKQIFFTLKLKNAEKEIVKGDTIEGYLVGVCGFDGSLSYQAMLTNVRAVCANTVASAMLSAKNSTAAFKARHTKNIRTKVIDSSATIAHAIDEFDKKIELYRHLANKPMEAQAMIDYVVNVFIEDKKEEPSHQMIAKVNRVLDLLTEQEGYDMLPAMHGTAWQAYNAVSQYLTHEQGRTPESRLNSQWFGQSATMNEKALQLALN